MYANCWTVVRLVPSVIVYVITISTKSRLVQYYLFIMLSAIPRHPAFTVYSVTVRLSAVIVFWQWVFSGCRDFFGILISDVSSPGEGNYSFRHVDLQRTLAWPNKYCLDYALVYRNDTTIMAALFLFDLVIGVKSKWHFERSFVC